MNKKILGVAVLLMSVSGCLFGCDSKKESKNDNPHAKDLIDAAWLDSYEDSKNGFASKDNVKKVDTYVDNKLITEPELLTNKDVKHVFYGSKNARIVSMADGYAFTFPSNKTINVDASLSKLRTKYLTSDGVLTVTFEDQNPYGNTKETPNGTLNGWNTYLNEWLKRFIDSPRFILDNNLAYIQVPTHDANYKGLYDMYGWDIEICDYNEIEYPYYHIRVLRPKDDYIRFYLFVLKSKTRDTSQIDMVIDSFKVNVRFGVLKNIQQAYELKIPDYWNDETKAYYNKLQNQNYVDWGFFSYSMPSDTVSSGQYESEGQRIIAERKRLEETFDYKYDILPTYMHIGWQYDNDNTDFSKMPLHYFPKRMAKAMAYGNGFDDKAVLQFTYQFTLHNNEDLEGYTPMFDIMRGVFDNHFRMLARNIKEYAKPVLFRLNNEMNTDWTSYCGMITLLDPDFFIQTWVRLYNIFREEGVDNAIWIFNPIATSCPYSNWGDYLNYMPGSDYVQLLGLTSYEMGNDAKNYRSFEDHYKTLYGKNTPYFDNFPAIISEFAAGAGGERQMNYDLDKYEKTEPGRNQDKQTEWVNEMFSFFNKENKDDVPCVKNIKAAVWFSCNDVVTLEDDENPGTQKTYSYNMLKLDESLTSTLEAMKQGLQQAKALKNK